MYNMKLEKELKQQRLIIEILLLFDKNLCFQEVKIFICKYSLSSALVLLFLDYLKIWNQQEFVIHFNVLRIS